ncbi:hypothetical protein OROGR_001305 [Orobanche gracilis]
MEVENMNKKFTTNEEEEEEEDDHDDVPLPGFRFHPTDEELVGFYLRRKVENKPINIELIKQADIYKYDPWDLPKSKNVEEKDKEWYFYCKRGRKYKNSVRPNRVTGSGFWKATGIDRPIYSGLDCIGLKKSLVFYRGSAGKGTKTEWMMHEFRMPEHMNDAIAIKYNAQETEVWTLCRILKRNDPYRKCIRDQWKQMAAKKSNTINYPSLGASSETRSISEPGNRNGTISYMNLSAPIVEQDNINGGILYSSHTENTANQKELSSHASFVSDQGPTPASSSFSDYDIYYSDIDELIGTVEWEDIRSMVECTDTTTTTTATTSSRVAASDSMYL